MGTLHKATAQRQRGCVDTLDTQRVQANQCADHVHDGIHTAQLMQMHLIKCRAVDTGFHPAQAPEDRHRPLLDIR